MKPNVVRVGQKTWHGQTKSQVLARANQRAVKALIHGRVPGSPGDADVFYREMDMVAWIRSQARRMADDD